MKKIIAVEGGESVGKTTSIRLTYEKLVRNHPEGQVENLEPGRRVELLKIITINELKIGFESQGDPTNEIAARQRLEVLVGSGCNIIVCACRPSGNTKKAVELIKSLYGFSITWKRKRFASQEERISSNKKMADEIVAEIEEAITATYAPATT